jgi:hypothetical protein
VDHLFFGCIVATNIWGKVSKFFVIQLGLDYLTIARFWIANKKHAAMNAICSANLWSIWNIRNALIFDNQTWLSIKQVWWLVLRTPGNWRLVFKAEMLRAPAAIQWG